MAIERGQLATDSVSGVASLYFHLNTTGSSFTSFRYRSIRVFNSAFELTRIPRNNVRASLPKKDSTRFSHEPCLGVKMNSKRFGTLAKYARVCLEICAEWLSRTTRM